MPALGSPIPATPPSSGSPRTLSLSIKRFLGVLTSAAQGPEQGRQKTGPGWRGKALAVPGWAQEGMLAGHYPGNQSRASLSFKTGEEAAVSARAGDEALVPRQPDLTVGLRTRTLNSQAKAPGKRVRVLGT